MTLCTFSNKQKRKHIVPDHDCCGVSADQLSDDLSNEVTVTW